MAKYLLLAFVLLTNSLLSGCSASKEQEIGDDISDFRTWVNMQTEKVSDRTEEDWQRTKDDFKLRTQELDDQQENFSDEIKQEYAQLKQKFNDADEERARTLAQRESLTTWQERLLGSYADRNTITGANVRDVYIAFMDKVREEHKNWTDKDWEMAKMVRDELDKRKDEVDDDLTTDEQVKIKALQMEFRTLESSDDVRD
ncbi:DUF6565 domain-containing protein [Pontibacter vulgaris]|uniref:DUF6565 domain-containing protein n=1 Tax=Pontibacter vulgaris TaxID=2905679 RepID=UPI001FA6DF2B|nr:DUF6565 domain-containing protein [Pontibacter vulgaris]